MTERVAREEWRPVPGFDGYEVSSHGRVVSTRSGSRRILKPSPRWNGKPYLRVLMVPTGERRPQSRYVHQVVLEGFVGPRPDGYDAARHLDGNPLNNVPENLAWGTRSENAQDTILHGSHNHASKTHCGNGHLYDEVNTIIVVHRDCRACRENRYERRKARRAAEVAA